MVASRQFHDEGFILVRLCPSEYTVGIFLPFFADHDFLPRDVPTLVADYYLGNQRSELDWIRNGFRSWDIESDCAAPDVIEDIQKHVALTQMYWVGDQANY